MVFKKKVKAKPKKNADGAVKTFLSEYHSKKLDEFSLSKGLSKSMLLSILIDEEMLKGDKAFDFDFTLPDTINFAYAEEAKIILDYLTEKKAGQALETLTMRRFDLGIPNKERFLGGFKDCLTNGVLRSYKPDDRPNYKYAENFLHYENAKRPTHAIKTARKVAKELKQRGNLNKKYGPGGSHDT